MKSNISFNSSLCKFGIGVFETIKVLGARPIDLNLHIERMVNSIKELDLSIKLDSKFSIIDLEKTDNLYSQEDSNYIKLFLKNEITKYIKENDIIDKALRLTVFDEGYDISIRDIQYTKDLYDKGFRLNISPIKRGNSILYRHKTTNYYENIYTKNYAKKKGFDDGIFLNMDNEVLECSMSNIFFVKGKTIYTPSSKLPILQGTMKLKIMDICRDMSIEVVEGIIKLDELKEFESAFVTNSLMGIMRVTEIDGISYEDENGLLDSIREFLD